MSPRVSRTRGGKGTGKPAPGTGTGSSRKRAVRASPRRETRPSLVIVGTGRLGGALGLALSASGWPVRMHSRSDEGRLRTEALGLKPATPEDLRRARLVLLCVPDAEVPHVAETLATTLPRSVALVHTAGALSLGALGPPRGRALGSFHPLCAVSSARDSLAGHTASISTRSRTLRDVLRRMAVDVGLNAMEVPEGHRAAYHAGAVMSAGLMVALADAAVAALGAAGIPPKDALPALLPLMRSALRGVEARGLAGGLTGPIVRGDAGVVAAHLAALPDDVTPIYRLLSRRALKLASERLRPESRAALEKRLR
ncbi:DUF2520 domain-containing protein [Myxococcus llanfairpwllgwyngyllgogerychwyrndrobwllllantysiliogogogochensis]|uniref:DUF2520 domain-containing protein n=1 Tax=Myxococcus llanfairpwllgwyngyllgogerychwyrndrobwllllantysiliogogogochensis TaxID=2590453 RepID=A0A540WUL1_9BACT|nr:Rossmann-like and DUF2520 domain-containing protein [Myxococcus llanfairpwllgwyngyllgogerychwyrndrobwllllantysiliogogogochensis]TQF12617.1 DUF2520 domain-containing protein [Myxococcus llanfairpwllgwyngyllgogerychwyrndrobwllllantysiliogogogochensis]